MHARFVRVAENDRRKVQFFVDGSPVDGLTGDTLLVALLCNGSAVRQSEFEAGRRAGFCLMASCQDCWVWTEAGGRLRACDTPLAEGMRIVTSQPDATWASRG